MYTEPLAYASHVSASSHGYHDYHGEAVFVTPKQSSALDDRVVATHASFSWHATSVVVTQPGGQRLRYNTKQLVAVFAANSLPRGVHHGERITRAWDGAVFDVVSVSRKGDTLCCELAESDHRLH